MSENEKFTPPESKRKIITLNDLFDQTYKLLPEEYPHLISDREYDHHRARFQQTRYADSWIPEQGLIEDEEQENWFAERLRGSVLIDVGGGLSSMQDFSIDYGVSTYVCVDRFGQTRESPVDPRRPEQESDPTDTLHAIVVKADMLDFLSHLKDRSANLVINGIDLNIVPDSKYHEALANELARVVKPGGIIFGDHSEALNVLKRQTPPELRSVKFPASEWYQYSLVFERPE